MAYVDMLKNELVFLERVQVTGREAVAWCEVYAARQAELERLQTAPVATPSEQTK